MKESDVVLLGKEVGGITAECEPELHQAQTFSELTNLELTITSGSVSGKKTHIKKYSVNGVARRLSDFIGKFRSVLFTPQDLELITDGPGARRGYINSVLMQTDREYARNLFSYERALRQRNAVLEQIREGFARPSQLLFWDQLLIKTGMAITEKREQYVAFLNAFVSLTLQYHVSYDMSTISVERLAQYAQEEIASATTLVGPQRDDFHVEKKEDDRDVYSDIARFGSRGEQRLGVLWLKLAELSYIFQETKEHPVLLLDDIFSELDEIGRVYISSIIGSQQTICTTAEDEVALFLQKNIQADIIRLS